MERGPDWFDFYPVQERLLQHDSAHGAAFLVDVGGGVGHDLAAFVGKYPELAPRLVLEDQSHVLAEVNKQDFKLPDAVKRVETNFFSKNSASRRPRSAISALFSTTGRTNKLPSSCSISAMP